MRTVPTEIVVMVLTTLAAGPAWSETPTFQAELATDGDREGRADERALSSSSESVPQPWIHPSLPPRLVTKLEASLPLAARRLRDRAECRSLFEALEAGGLEALANTMYFSTTLRQERGLCRRASAFTQVGARQTRLCRSFGRLPDERAAVVLIHEALHQAGLGERPLNPRAPDSGQINQQVREGCAL